MYKVSLGSPKHLKLSVALCVVLYHGGMNIRARNETAGVGGVQPLRTLY